MSDKTEVEKIVRHGIAAAGYWVVVPPVPTDWDEVVLGMMTLPHESLNAERLPVAFLQISLLECEMQKSPESLQALVKAKVKNAEATLKRFVEKS